MRRRHILRLLPAGLLTGCGGDEAPKGPRFPKVPWRIVSTTHFTADLVRTVGGEAVQSLCFLPAGTNPHTFTPAGPDLAKFHTADMVMIHGLGLENRWPADFAEIDKSGVRTVTVTAGIPADRLLRPSGPGSPADPHVWNVPDLAVFMVEAVTAALSEVMPKLSSYFAPRGHRLKVEFSDLHRKTVTSMSELKETDRFLLTSHDSMQYFAKAYGLEARALAPVNGQVPEAVPADVLEWIRAHNVKSMFREASTDVLALRRLLAEAKVNPDHVIHSLSLPEKGTTGLVGFKTYEVDQAAQAVACNADTIQSALMVD